MGVLKKIPLIFLLLIALLLTGCSNAENIDFSEMIINIADTMPQVMGLVTATSYLVGITLALKGTYKLREYGELRTMMSSQVSLWPIITTLVAGFALIYFPSTFDVGMQTLFTYSNPLTYTGAPDQQTTELMNALVDIMQVIGAIAIIRGFMLLRTATQQGAQPGSFGKGITFMIGGVLGMNAYGTWDMLTNTVTGF